jgi:1,5-anhydro-D-fructose reductase (1,5-anhydro-D-mannitol-forming)
VIVTTEMGQREIKVEHKIPYDRTIEDFVAAVRGKGEPSVDGSDGVASLSLTLAALEAIETGRKVRI